MAHFKKPSTGPKLQLMELQKIDPMLSRALTSAEEYFNFKIKKEKRIFATGKGYENGVVSYFPRNIVSRIRLARGFSEKNPTTQSSMVRALIFRVFKTTSDHFYITAVTYDTYDAVWSLSISLSSSFMLCIFHSL